MSHRTNNKQEGTSEQNNIEAREDELNQTPLGKVNDFFKQIKFDWEISFTCHMGGKIDNH